MNDRALTPEQIEADLRGYNRDRYERALADAQASAQRLKKLIAESLELAARQPAFTALWGPSAIYIAREVMEFSRCNRHLRHAAYDVVDGEELDDDGSAEGIVWEVDLED